MTQEALPLIDALEAYRMSLLYGERHGETLGISSDELTDLYGEWLKGLALRMAQRFDKDVVVYRGPLLAKHLINLLTLARVASLDLKIAFMVRWPLDVVASMYSWDDRLQAKGKAPVFSRGAGDPERAQSCAKFHMSYYVGITKVADFAGSGITVVRYEDLVVTPSEVAARLGSLVGVDLSGGEVAWNNSLVTHTPELGDFVTPLYGRNISKESVGSGDSLVEKDVQDVLSHCRYVVREFYPERDSLKSNATSRAAPR
jgi:hypothetical protein